jgi:monofunctional biosynthetic peptidoglycan transglycosylase
MDEQADKPVEIPAEIPEDITRWKKYLRKSLVILKWIVILFFGSTLFAVILFSFVNPPVTPLMIQRVIEQKSDGKKAALHKKWVPLKNFANMVRAVVASRITGFLSIGVLTWSHSKAVEYNKRHRRKHGASTITTGGKERVPMAFENMAS